MVWQTMNGETSRMIKDYAARAKMNPRLLKKQWQSLSDREKEGFAKKIKAYIRAYDEIHFSEK